MAIKIVKRPPDNPEKERVISKNVRNLDDIYFASQNLYTDKDAYELALEVIANLQEKSSLSDDERYLVNQTIMILETGQFYSYEKDGNRPIRKNDLSFLLFISFVLGMGFLFTIIQIANTLK